MHASEAAIMDFPLFQDIYIILHDGKIDNLKLAHSIRFEWMYFAHRIDECKKFSHVNFFLVHFWKNWFENTNEESPSANATHFRKKTRISYLFIIRVYIILLVYMSLNAFWEIVMIYIYISQEIANTAPQSQRNECEFYICTTNNNNTYIFYIYTILYRLKSVCLCVFSWFLLFAIRTGTFGLCCIMTTADWSHAHRVFLKSSSRVCSIYAWTSSKWSHIPTWQTAMYFTWIASKRRLIKSTQIWHKIYISMLFLPNSPINAFY